jgi:hypothetical protein
LKKILVLFLIVMALVAGAAFVACGGGGDNKDNGEKATPVAQETQAGNETPAAKETPAAEATTKPGGGGGGSLEDVPIYPGVKSVSSGEWSGSEAMIPAIGGNENPADFSTIKYGMYETDDSPSDVFDWYKDKMSGWKEEWVFSSGGDDGAGSVGIWSKDDGKTAAWIVVSEDSGTTSLTIMTGSQ